MASTLSDDVFDLGDRVKMRLELRDAEADDALVNADELTFVMKEPDDVLTTYVFGTDSELVQAGIGTYYVNWDAAKVGVHWARWVAVGSVAGAEERGFRVRASKVI